MLPSHLPRDPGRLSIIFDTSDLGVPGLDNDTLLSRAGEAVYDTCSWPFQRLCCSGAVIR